MKKLLNFLWMILEEHSKARAAMYLINSGHRREAQQLLSK
jgi:hypothetical protein